MNFLWEQSDDFVVHFSVIVTSENEQICSEAGKESSEFFQKEEFYGCPILSPQQIFSAE